VAIWSGSSSADAGKVDVDSTYQQIMLEVDNYDTAHSREPITFVITVPVIWSLNAQQISRIDALVALCPHVQSRC